jgi:hypothetical protein
MDNKQEQPQPKEQPKPAKPKRNRKFHKEIIEDSATALTLRVKHQPHKGEKISDTIRRDKKFNPRQRFTDLNGRLL